jgi:hypothetical protein
LFIFWHAFGPTQLEFETVECPDSIIHALAPMQASFSSMIVLNSDELEQALKQKMSDIKHKATM